MKRVSIAVFTVFFALSLQTFSQPPDARTERLIGLAKVWNTAKYFHHTLAERDIDWDKALVETITKVNSAKSCDDYQRAVNEMLSRLDDKSTFVSGVNPAAPSASNKANISDATRIVDNVLIVDLYTAARAVSEDQSLRTKFNLGLMAALANVKGVVIDCRSSVKIDLFGEDFAAYEFDDLLRGLIPRLLEHNLRLGTSRYRMYNGYAPQNGTTSGGYYAGTVTDTPVAMTASGKKAVPISFIINANSPDESSVWGAMQSAGVASVVQDGELVDELGASTAKLDLPDGLVARIRVSELVNSDGSTGFHPDAKADTKSALNMAIDLLGKPKKKDAGSIAASVQIDAQEKTYDQMKFPSAEYRLLALFRFWGVIQNFYTNKNLIADSWPTVLERFIPKFEANTNAYDYQATVRELSTELHDTHGFVANTPDLDERFGAYTPPVAVRYVEGQPVVLKVLDDKLPLKPGDVILTVDGRPEKAIRDEVARLIAVSTPQALMWAASPRFLHGPKDSVAKLTVRSGNGAVRTVEVVRALLRNDPKYYKSYDRTGDVVQVLPSGFGYVDLGRLQGGEVDDMFKKIAGTKGVIFDMRGYPNGTAWDIAPRLTDKVKPVAALFSRPMTSGRDLYDADLTGTGTYSFSQTLPLRHGDIYRGKVVMLIDETAISQAEHTCLFLESATDVTFIGMPTNGANGDVTNVILPGGIRINFSGQTVRHADGRQLQRVGIIPTIKVMPTIAGITAGRDEILAAGVRYLKSVVK